jgi:hypothetical protein
MKEKMAYKLGIFRYSSLLVFYMVASANADLAWHDTNGNSLDEITLDIGQTSTVYIYETLPAYHEYSVQMGNNASTVAEIAAVAPTFLAGPLATVTDMHNGWWILENGWEGALPIEGLAAGNYSLNTDYYGTDGYNNIGSNDILSITVVPEPATILLLSLGCLGLVRKHRVLTNKRL